MMEISWEFVERVVAAFLAGILLGYEREYRNKPAGLRTIVLISVGSCLFSLLNLTLNSGSQDRIASTVVTGVGFVGAGVIFKEGANVKGITTAATIWIAAAIGMAFGFGQYWLGAITLALVLLTLTLLFKLENHVPSRQVRNYKVSFNQSEFSIEKLEQMFESLKVIYTQSHFSKIESNLILEYRLDITGPQYKELVKVVKDKVEIRRFEKIE